MSKEPKNNPDYSPNGPESGGQTGGPALFTFFTEIGIIDQLARNRFERVLPEGLTMAQFSLLHHLERLGGSWNLVRLANAFQVSKAAMTKIVAKLHAKKMIAVVQDPADGRGKLVSLTPTGKKARDQALMQLAQTAGPFSEQFDSASFEQALPFLQAVRKWLDEHR